MKIQFNVRVPQSWHIYMIQIVQLMLITHGSFCSGMLDEHIRNTQLVSIIAQTLGSYQNVVFPLW